MDDIRLVPSTPPNSDDWQVVLIPRQTGGATTVVRAGPVAVDATTPVQPTAVDHMEAGPRIAIGVALGLLSAIILAHLLWVWSFTSRLIPGPAGTAPRQVRVHWLWLAFTPTVEWALVLLVVFAAAAASLAHLSLVFANRCGLKTLEPGWTWWYLLRPGAAAIVGVVTYVVLKAGFLGTVTDQDQNSLAFAAAVGALAGMFTDALIAKLRAAMGASAFEQGTGGAAADAATVPPASKNGAAPDVKQDKQPTSTITLPDQPTTEPDVAPARETISDPRVVQTDNRPRPEDGEQDVDQHPAPYPGSPSGPDGLDEGGGEQ